MAGFSEAWLRDYQRRSTPSVQIGTRAVQIVLSHPVKLLNVVLRMHWAERRKYAAALSAEIASLHSGIPAPMQRARVTLDRYSVAEPDHDGLVGGCKLLIDCLLVRSDRHPHGLGYIVDDSQAHLEFIARHVKARRGEQRTVVLIEAVL